MTSVVITNSAKSRTQNIVELYHPMNLLSSELDLFFIGFMEACDDSVFYEVSQSNFINAHTIARLYFNFISR
jgi:hypothetical protein